MIPVTGLIDQRSGLCAAAAEDYCGDGNAGLALKLGADAGAVDCRSGETGVGVCALAAVGAVPLFALPVFRVLGRILVHAFPPHGVVVKIVNNVGEDGVLLGCGKSVGIGLCAGAGCNAEEAVFGVYCPQSAVGTDAQPCDIVADRPALPALFAVSLGRNEHCEVCFAACGRECAADVADLALRIFNTEDEHMLCHPVLFSAEGGGYAQSKALFAEQNVSAVAGVDGHDGVVLREVDDVSLLGVELSLGMQALDIVGTVADSIERLGADTGHDRH